MKNTKRFLLGMMLTVALFGVKTTYSQSLEDATNAYNRGVELAATDLPKAIEALTEAATIAEKAGPEAAEIMNVSRQQIPALQYNHATNLYKEKKVEEAITNFELAHEYATKYGDDAIKAKSADLLPKLYRAKGNNEYKDENYTDALASLDKALEYDPDYAGAWLSKGLIYNKQNDDAKLREAMDKAIETGTKTKDEKTVEQASKYMGDNLVGNANAAFKKNDFDGAIAILDESVKYADNNAEAYYLYALSYNKLSKWDEAIASSTKGLELDNSSPENQARFYFEMGMAQAGKGATGDACASFKKAAKGQFTESANYQIKTVLKCS
jgi:tetratricopeptide (TPR) repeat protein